MATVVPGFGGPGNPQAPYGQYYSGAMDRVPHYQQPLFQQLNHHPHHQSALSYPNEPDFLRSPQRKDVFGWLGNEALTTEYADVDPFA